MCQVNEDEDEDEDEDDCVDNYDPEDDKLVVPRCCKQSEEQQVVFLKIPYEDWVNGIESKPKWTTNAWNSKDLRFSNYTTDISYCPFCGQHLPNITKCLIPPKKPIATCSDGGYYCDTCKKRLIECKCLRPEKAWDSNNYDPRYPAYAMCKCGHHYIRHFDTYEDMRAVGCKYCECRVFELDKKSDEII